MGGHHLHPHDHGDGHKHGPLQHLPAGGKLAGALFLILTVVLLPRTALTGLLMVAAVIGGLLAVSQIPLWFLLKRLLLLEPLVLGVAGLMWFQPDGGKIFALVMFKANLCLLTTILLSNTTPFAELLRVLQRLRMPWVFVTTLTLMHRYLFVLRDEAERMRRARASRTFTRGRRFQWLALSSVLGQLFVRASERAERIYNAMCARGWK
ncbi:MAG: cobalt ECF transporter T component CbiQ [Verrucomicrobiota bacterium]|jgi:cobalt/nickel transport system permease protein